MLHWSGVLQDTSNLVLLTKLVNCKLERGIGIFGFAVLAIF